MTIAVKMPTNQPMLISDRTTGHSFACIFRFYCYFPAYKAFKKCGQKPDPRKQIFTAFCMLQLDSQQSNCFEGGGVAETNTALLEDMKNSNHTIRHATEKPWTFQSSSCHILPTTTSVTSCPSYRGKDSCNVCRPWSVHGCHDSDQRWWSMIHTWGNTL